MGGPSPSLLALPALASGFWPDLEVIEAVDVTAISKSAGLADHKRAVQIDLNRLHLLNDGEKAEMVAELLEIIDQETDCHASDRSSILPNTDFNYEAETDSSDFPVAFGFEQGDTTEMTNDEFDAMLRYFIVQ